MAINFTPIQEVLTAVVSIVPNLIDLITGILPAIIAIAIVTFIAGFFGKVLSMMDKI